MALQLPSRQPLLGLQTEVQQRIPTEDIIKIQGQSTGAYGIQEAGKLIGKALEERARRKYVAEQISALRDMVPGMTEQQRQAFSGIEDLNVAQDISKQMINSNLSLQQKEQAAEAKRQSDLAEVGQLETALGLKPGVLGDNPTNARFLAGNTIDPVTGQVAPRFKLLNPKQPLSPLERPKTPISRMPIKQQERLYKMGTDMLSRDKSVQELEGLASSTYGLKALLKENPDNAFGLIAGQMAELAKEKKKTDEDIQRNIAPQDVRDRLSQTLTLVASGKFPKERIQDMLTIMDIVAQSAYDTYQKKLNAAIKATKPAFKDYNLDDEEVKTYIRGSSLLTERPEPVSDYMIKKRRLEELKAKQQGGR